MSPEDYQKFYWVKKNSKKVFVPNLTETQEPKFTQQKHESAFRSYLQKANQVTGNDKHFTLTLAVNLTIECSDHLSTELI